MVMMMLGLILWVMLMNMVVVYGRCIEKDGKLVCRSTGRSGVEMEIRNKPEICRRAITSVDVHVRECMGVDPHALIRYLPRLKVIDARDTNICQMDIEGISSMCLSIYIYIYITSDRPMRNDYLDGVNTQD